MSHISKCHEVYNFSFISVLLTFFHLFHYCHTLIPDEQKSHVFHTHHTAFHDLKLTLVPFIKTFRCYR
jgi:hypothetical protein